MKVLMALKRGCVLLVLTGIANACFAQSGVRGEHVVTTRLETTRTYLPGTTEYAAAVAWLKDRKEEGQVPDLPNVSLDALGTITVSRSSVRSAGGKSADDIVIPDPSPDALPKTGKQGDTFSYSSCSTGGPTITYSFTWSSSANDGKGGWVISKVVYTASSPSCG